MSKSAKDAGSASSHARRNASSFLLNLSHYGVHPAHYTGHDCTGCGICFYCCPEPGAIAVYRLAAPPKTVATQAQAGGENAAAL